ncbi:hypothetical protein DFH08DRAFT_691450 [Mycena albidolilacea]|uniref:Uncharacterized protein n=1 Tax=Mycena albidolilacea TaxID=1033008 RepID=A0AAD7AC81_9AGAR|nr:hypothetical protein DFH08DRAFT_691450 [Mycena albidolilacea]
MVVLPPYSSSAPAPTYSTSPRPDEYLLQRTPFSGHSRPTGTFVRNKHGMTVVLNGQKENTLCPSFGRDGVLSGTLFIDSPETVTAVNIKLEGFIECSLTQGYSRSEVVDQTGSLYAKDGPHRKCPGAIPFARRFPSTFDNHGIHYALPPSCDITLPASKFLRCTYSLIINIVYRSARFLSKEKSLLIELEYRHRTRPSRPRIAERSLRSTIKMCPEEWLQLPVALTAALDPRPPGLFVPSLGVFGISETVPFHLQLSGPTRCLRDLFVTPPYSVQQKYSSVLRVSLLRQIAVDESHIGQKINTILEECSLRPLPPGIFGVHSSTSDDVLNWEGEINLQDIDTPSFDIGTIKVMYLIAVELCPPKSSPIQRAHFGFPMKITTDTWVDSAEQHF